LLCDLHRTRIIDQAASFSRLDCPAITRGDTSRS
jgi:hypothetical protein